MTVATPTSGTLDPHAMQCMEIWGGNRAIDNAVSAPGLDVWVHSRPHEGAAEGGDIHYVSMCAAGRISRFVVADVAGHGAGVGALSGALRTLVRKNINTLDQSKFARSLNEAFKAASTSGRFATAIMAAYFSPTDHLVVCNAGHPPPLVHRAADGSWAYLRADDAAAPEGGAREIANLPFGIIEPTDYHQFATRLERGDMVLFYTDAAVEQRGPGGEQLGEDGLLRAVERSSGSGPEGLLPALRAELAALRDGAPLDDDLTLVLLHHNASEPDRQSIGERLRIAARMLGLSPV